MKKRVISVLLCFAMLTGCLYSVPGTQAAKKAKLNKSGVTLKVGKSYKLKVKNYKGKIKWKSSKKKVAVVNSSGKVTAKGKGTAKVTARLVKSKKTLSCRVVVRDAESIQTIPVTDSGNSSAGVQTVDPTTPPTNESGNGQGAQPTKDVVNTPTDKPAATATGAPDTESTDNPAPTMEPTKEPTAEPTDKPLVTTEPTKVPTTEPTDKPLVTTEPTKVPTAEPTDKPLVTTEPTKAPTAEPTDKPAATATKAPQSEPTKEPTQGTVTYKLDTDTITAGSASGWTEESDGTVTYDNVDLLLIPLPEKYNVGDKVNVKVYGQAEGSTPRIWISNGAWTACSNQISPYTFEATVTLEIINADCDSIQIKAANSGDKFTSLTISAVYISKGDIEESSAVVPGTEVTPTPTPGPTATPPVYGPTKAPAKIVTAKDAYVETSIPEDYKDYKSDVEYGDFIVNDTYYSDITKSNRTINIALPANYEENNRYPVVYVLHGIGCSKEMFGTSMESSSIAKIAANLRAQNKAKDMIIVFANIRVSDTPENEVHSNENYKYYDDFREELIDNLMPYMQRNYGVATGRENTAVCGWSMGGREALYIGLSKPEKFGFCAGFCPAFGLLPYTNEDVGKSEEGLLTVGDGSEDIIELPEEYRDNTYVQVSHGIYDSVVHDEPVRYHNALDKGNVPNVYTEYASGHSDGVYDPGFYVFASNLFKTVDSDEVWVTTWGTAEEKNDISADSAMPKIPLEDSTIRQVIKVTTSGEKMRIKLSNQYCSSDVTIKSLHIAKQVEADKSTILTSTDTVVTVGGQEEFVIPAGQIIVTDEVDFSVDALENVAVSMYFGSAVTENITGHRGARATTYQMSGNNVSAETFTDYKTTTSWFFLADVSLLQPEGSKAVVCFGDSITDGYGTDATYLGKKPDSYTRWVDYFARRLQANEDTRNISVINEGIGANSIFGSYPTDAGKDRFKRDLLEHDGVGYCIILFGVNDLNKLSDTSKAASMIAEYEKMIALAHENDIKVYAAPILPFGTSSYYSESSEAVRVMINDWFRSEESGVDGIIDFESAVADPDNPKNILEEYTHEDGLHPYDGYEVMANAIDLTLFGAKATTGEGDNPTATPAATPAATEEPESEATPTPTPKPTTTPTATPKPTAPPEMLDHYSAPYTLIFNDKTVATSGSGASYTVNEDGSVTISVNKQYCGISFCVPDSVTENNFDTVTITYKDPVNMGSGYGCGLWRNQSSNSTEDVVSWGGIFADTDSSGNILTSGSKSLTIAGNENTKAWYITKCLLFHNDSSVHEMTPSAQVTITSVVFSHSKYDSSLPTATPKPTETPRPTTAPTVTAKPSEEGGFITENYEYASDYTLGWNGGIVAYQNGTKKSLEDAGVTVYDKETDRPFMAEKLQGWNNAKLILTQPVKYTTSDGTVHDVESMLTNFDFIADPTAIDNSDVDGKLYVYGTTEGFSYKDGALDDNQYSNHSLTILSTTDMVNWTDEGFIDNENLTNEVSDSDQKTKCGWATKAWAPSGLAYDGDGDGDLEYYIFYTNGGAVGYVMGDSPTGPWKDPLGKTLFTQSSPNCSGVVWCFDPAVLVDDKGDAYVYFGGGTTDDKAHSKTGRVCKIKFKEGTGEVEMDGEPVEMDTYYMFEDSEINQFNGKYYYSYCTNFNVPGNDKWATSGSIAVYVSSDPLDIAFDPAGDNGEQYTGDDGIYHHYLGTILQNPSLIFGQTYNNHHHMQSFKGKDYIFYHSTVLNNSIHRSSKCYRNLHVDEITVDKDTDEISVTPTYAGAEQVENFNPYVDFNGEKKEINATTTSYSAGVCSRQSDARIKDGLSPMVLDEIDTGDWTKLQGVDFEDGAKTFSAVIASETDEAAVELYIDSPLNSGNKVATIMVESTGSQEVFNTFTTSFTKTVSGVHDVYFVFRGTDYDVASWSFDKNEAGNEGGNGGSEAEDKEYNVTISSDNVYGTIEPGEVDYSDGTVTFDAASTYGGTGVIFTPAGKDVAFNISDYAKLVIEVSADASGIPVEVGMYQYDSKSNVFTEGNRLEMSSTGYTTPSTAGEKLVIEYDLDNVNLWQRENDIYGVGVKCSWNTQGTNRLTVHSIKFVKPDTVVLPELESIKGVSDPVFGNTGTCINYSELSNRNTLNYLTTHYSSITLENEMKPDSILSAWNPSFISVSDAKSNTADYIIPDSYTESTVPKLNFSTIDKVLKIAKHYGIKLRAHTLVWHAQTPEFFFREGYDSDGAYVSEEIMDARLEMYIRSVMHHVYTLDDGAYKDVVYTWDVANEYMHNDEDKNWSAVYGNRSVLGNKPGYIKKAFQIAHDCLEEYGIADTVTLVYNDFNTYYDCRDKIIEMVNYINQEEKICDGVGMQSHLGVTFPSVESYLETVKAFLQEGFEVQITELDIGIDPENSSLTYETQAEYVSQLMTGLIDIQNTIGGITGITWWGMYDAISWRGGYSSSGNSHPLLFDENMYDPKPSYYAFIEAFK